MKDPWFAIALAEFFILLLVFIPKVVASIPKTTSENKKKKDGGRMGVISKTDFVIRGLMGSGGAATIFEIHEPDDKTSYAGVFEHDYSIREGETIEFWPSSEIIARKNIPRNEVGEDGARSSWTEKLEYYKLKKYRIIPPKEMEHTEGEVVQAE
ncbi:MAG: hypothetical protein WC120_02760 [Parcubacteria group bacterium]